MRVFLPYLELQLHNWKRRKTKKAVDQRNRHVRGQGIDSFSHLFWRASTVGKALLFLNLDGCGSSLGSTPHSGGGYSSESLEERNGWAVGELGPGT